MKIFKYNMEAITEIQIEVRAEVAVKMIFKDVADPDHYFFFSESVTDWMWSYEDV